MKQFLQNCKKLFFLHMYIWNACIIHIYSIYNNWCIINLFNLEITIFTYKYGYIVEIIILFNV